MTPTDKARQKIEAIAASLGYPTQATTTITYGPNNEFTEAISQEEREAAKTLYNKMTLPTMATILFNPTPWLMMTNTELETFQGIEGTGYIAFTHNWTFVADHTPQTIVIQAFPTAPNTDNNPVTNPVTNPDYLTWVLDNNGD